MGGGSLFNFGEWFENTAIEDVMHLISASKLLHKNLMSALRGRKIEVCNIGFGKFILFSFYMEACLPQPPYAHFMVFRLKGRVFTYVPTRNICGKCVNVCESANVCKQVR